MSIFATKEEIEQLTGCRTVAAQIKWLMERKIPVVTNMLNNIIITRADVEYYRSKWPHRKLDPFSHLLDARAHKGKVRVDRRAIGIYLLKKGETVVYVGQTTNFLSRSANHVGNAEFDFDYIEFIPVPKSQLSLYEHELIARLCPKYNVMHNTYAQPAFPPNDSA